MSANMKPVVYRGEVVEGYFVNSNGDIYSNKRGATIKLKLSDGDKYNPYPKYGLTHKGKRITVTAHRLVAETYHKKPIPNILTDEQWETIPKKVRGIVLDYMQHADRYQVNHIEHNILNFHPSNLEWVTISQNQQAFQNFRKNSLHS